MKIPTLRQVQKRGAIIAAVAMLALFLFAAGGFCATGEGHEGDHGTKGWVATDTFRVMNFLVLAVGLFFLARKPVSQGLKGRIKGIQDQLADLEAKKKRGRGAAGPVQPEAGAAGPGGGEDRRGLHPAG